MHLQHQYVAIEGVIGIGKTTLARLLQKRFQSSILLEVFEENPFLADFYGDRQRYAFQTQIFFLLSRYHQQHKAVPEALRKGLLISDYTFSKDELFAWLNLKDDELAMYGRVHAALSEKIPKPDLIVYLKAKHEVVMHRIALRDRPYERDMDPEYIRLLAEAYEAWLSNLTDIQVLTIDVSEMDFLAQPDDLESIALKMERALQEKLPQSPGYSVENQLLEDGRLASFQQFHNRLDEAKSFDPDLFFNYILLTEELGEVAKHLVKVWGEAKYLEKGGKTAAEAHQEALARSRAGLRGELADLLAYTIKLANYAGIDLERAYRDKMRHNIDRTWQSERTLPGE